MLTANLAALTVAQGSAPDVSGPSPLPVVVDDRCSPPSVRCRVEGRWIALHSRHDPAGEAERWLAEAGVADDARTAFVLGAGLGYVVDAWLGRSAAHRAIVLEPIADAARLMLARRDWTDAIASGRLRLLVGPSYTGAATAWKLVVIGRPPAIVAHPVLARVWAEGAATARSVADRILFDAHANHTARGQLGATYLLNTLANIGAIAREGDVAALDGLFAGRPAVIASAGPSLDQALPDLKALADRAIVIAVDTALRPLLTAGIVPHLVLAVDPTAENAAHLNELPDCGDVTLVAEASVDPSAMAGFRGRTILFRVGDHQPWPWLGAAGFDLGTLAVWGSVATAAVDVARRLGCDPLVFCGQDLAFAGERAYCLGTTWDWEWSLGSMGDDPIDSMWSGTSARWPPVQTLDIHGSVVTTAGHLLAVRDWLVEQSLTDGCRRYINSSSAGTLFGGRIEQLSLRDALGPASRFEPGDVRTALADARIASLRPTEAVLEYAAVLRESLRTEGGAPTTMEAFRTLAPSVSVAAVAQAIETGLSDAVDGEPRRSATTDLQRVLVEDLRRACGPEALPDPARDGAMANRAVCDRLRAAYAQLVRDGLCPRLPVLPRRDLLRLAHLVTDVAPRDVLVLGDDCGLTTLLAAAAAPSAAVATMPGGTTRTSSHLGGVRARAARLAGVSDRAASSHTAEPSDLVIVQTEDDEELGPRLVDAVSRVRCGGTLAIVDTSDRVVGARIRRGIAALLMARPDVLALDQGHSDWFTRLVRLDVGRATPAGGNAVATAPSPMGSPEAARALARAVVSAYHPRRIAVFGDNAATWAAPFQQDPGLIVRVVDDTAADVDIGTVRQRDDVAICVDTLELAAPEHAARLLSLATAASPVVVFSSPGPGYFPKPYPNQRPMPYWAERFLEHGYLMSDELRQSVEDRDTLWLHEWDLVTFTELPPGERLAVAGSARLRCALLRSAERIQDLSLQASLLRVAAVNAGLARRPSLDTRPTTFVPVQSGDMVHERGHCFRVRLARPAGRLVQSALVDDVAVHEDGQPLPFADALADVLETEGHGRYAVRARQIYFSSSDGSDPRTNGRRYALEVPSRAGRLLEWIDRQA